MLHRREHPVDGLGVCEVSYEAWGDDDSANQLRLRCSHYSQVFADWHEKAVALGYDGVTELIAFALPCIVNSGGDERGGWISVADRLPEQWVPVLVWHESYEHPRTGRLLSRDDGNAWTVGGVNAHDDLRRRHPQRLAAIPSHWRPMVDTP